MGFEYPWQYSFPPFFTLQPNIQTRAVQLEAWRSLILSYCQHNRIDSLEVQQSLNEPLFNNREINRQLNYDSLMAVLEFLREKGNVEWTDKRKVKCFVYWKTPEEWSKLVYQWVQKKSLTNTVCTFYEILSGDDTTKEEFHGLNEDVFRKAISVLEKDGKAALITIDDGQGVKFF